MTEYWETPLYALRLAEGRLEMLLDADFPESDHPGATRYVLGVVRAAIADTHPQGEDVQQASSLMSGGGAGTAIAQRDAA